MNNLVILETVVGSTLHGTVVDDGLEDLDIMAIVVEEPELIIGLYPEESWVTRTKPEGVRSEAGDTDMIAYGLRKFVRLALKGNPSVLFPLFAPPSAIRQINEFGHSLREITKSFISKQVYATFRGYMRQQHERLLGLRGQRNITRPELVHAHGYDTKYASHIIRLGIQGEELLLTGKITLPMPLVQRGEVVAIRRGEFTLAEVSNKIIDAETRVNMALANSPLPDNPDSKQVQEWMLNTYLTVWKRNG